MPDDPKLYDLVENIDRKLDANHREHGSRLDGHDAKLREHDEQFRTHSSLLRDHAGMLTSIGGSTARAIDIALEAKRDASRSVDEATKIVESAIRMHSASIASTVQGAVKSEIAPIVVDLGKVKESDEAKAVAITDLKTSMDALTTMMKSVVKALGHPKLRWLLIVCAAIGALAGGAAAGWKAHDVTKTIAR